MYVYLYEGEADFGDLPAIGLKSASSPGKLLTVSVKLGRSHSGRAPDGPSNRKRAEPRED